MTNKDKQYYIYIRATGEKVPVTMDEFDNYYRDINSYRIKQQRQGKCVCPKTKRFSCDMDCWTCPFRRGGNSLSFDFEDTEDGDEFEYYSANESMSLLDEDFAEIDEVKRLFSKLCELIPEAETIASLRLDGYTFSEISEKLGIKNSTLSMRIKAAKNKLSKEFPDFF